MEFSLCVGLECIDCGRQHPFAYILKCEACGGLLDLQYDLSALKRNPVSDGRFYGMWKYHAVLPVRNEEHVVSMGEGTTPFLKAPRLAARIGVKELYLKYEGTNPTGTVKDRTSSTAVSSALQFGFDAISVVSTGNAGVSIANYARRAGLKSAVFCYEKGDPLKMKHIGLMATRLFAYQGEYDDVIELFDKVIEEGRVFDGGARRNPFKHEGKKTIAYEVVQQLGRAPDYFFAQTSGCEIFIASFRGFLEMRELGYVERLPTLVCVQSALANPIVKAFRKGGRVEPMTAGPTVAKGLAAGKPGPKGDRVLRILREHRGAAIEVSDDEVIEAQRLLVEAEGLWSGPTGASTLAALKRALEQQEVDPAKCFVCLITETGLTSEYPAFEAERIEPSRKAIEEALLRLQ